MNKYIGLEFEHKGRGPKYDCFGLVQVIYKEKLGIALPEYIETYDYNWAKSGRNYIVDSIDEDFYEVHTYKKFDIMLFYCQNSLIVSHMGLFLSENKFLHISELKTSSIDRIEGYWKGRLYKVIRYGKSSV